MLKKYIEADRRAVELFKETAEEMGDKIVAAVMSCEETYPAVMKMMLEKVGDSETLYDKLMGKMKGLTIEDKALTISAYQVRAGISIAHTRGKLPEILKESEL